MPTNQRTNGSKQTGSDPFTLSSRLGANVPSAGRAFAPSVTNDRAYFPFYFFLFVKRMTKMLLASDLRYCRRAVGEKSAVDVFISKKMLGLPLYTSVHDNCWQTTSSARWTKQDIIIDLTRLAQVSSKKPMAHDDVTCGKLAWKI